MPFEHTNLRASISVLLVLAFAFVLTGMASSAYRRERFTLGVEHHSEAERLAHSGSLNQATEEYRRALIFSPDNTDYRLSLANALLDAGRLNEAESHLEQLQQEDSSNIDVNLALARVAAREGKWNLAIEYYQRTVYAYWPQQLIPRRHAIRWELIDLLQHQNRRNEVVGELIQLYATTPPEIAERARIGQLLLKYGATSEASQVFRELVKRDPQNNAVHRGMAEVAFAQGDYVAARHEYQRALHLNTADIVSRDNLAQTNAVIEVDSSLPGINSSERVRRATNLLSRTISDLEKCGGEGIADHADRFESARQLLDDQSPASNDDRTAALQAMAIKLWALRPSLCGTNAAPDKPVELALAGIPNE